MLDPEDLVSGHHIIVDCNHTQDRSRQLSELTTDQPVNRKRRHDDIEMDDLDAFVLPWTNITKRDRQGVPSSHWRRDKLIASIGAFYFGRV